ncbi:hypothetical protein RDWZM_003136 [Blomia tropicalis]|uniref:Uncharacterized protein n=1 Tax=Blomia tropicalis TaxID=40697 RepID=A0A9Q0RSS3_BLOTA|nr:hypothetical protein RDWZM_003136 [Blomia tropicalis]
MYTTVVAIININLENSISIKGNIGKNIAIITTVVVGASSSLVVRAKPKNVRKDLVLV